MVGSLMQVLRIANSFRDVDVNARVKDWRFAEKLDQTNRMEYTHNGL
jgi:hypothetical protein